jgi:hypothetical protein
MTDKWYLAHNKKRLGPYSVEQLQQLAGSGQLRRTDMLLKAGDQKWAPASSFEELFAGVPEVPGDGRKKSLWPVAASGVVGFLLTLTLGLALLVWRSSSDGDTVEKALAEKKHAEGEAAAAGTRAQQASAAQMIAEKEAADAKAALDEERTKRSQAETDGQAKVLEEKRGLEKELAATKAALEERTKRSQAEAAGLEKVLEEKQALEKELAATKAALEDEKDKRKVAEGKPTKLKGATREEPRVMFVKSLEPQVTEGISEDTFLKINPDAKLVTDNRAESFKEYTWGDNTAQNHVVFIRNKLVCRRFSVFCFSKADAEKAVRKFADKLGTPDTTIIPSSEKDMILHYFWNIRELGFSVACGIKIGSLVDGTPAYFYHQMVANIKPFEPR